MNTRQLRKPVLPPLPFQTPGEEIANAVTHGVGVLLAIAGLVLFFVRASGGRGAGALALISCVIFTVAMISLFLASTLYHAVQHEGAKRVLRILDHSAIYLLIAGTYTPFCLLGLKGALGWSFFGVEWSLAITGITLYAVNCRLLKKAELGVYMLMGWAIVAGWFRLMSTIPAASLLLLAGGGVAYTLGTIWYSKPHRRGTHVIWHVFVLAGAVCHWWSIWLMSYHT